MLRLLGVNFISGSSDVALCSVIEARTAWEVKPCFYSSLLEAVIARKHPMKAVGPAFFTEIVYRIANTERKDSL